MNDVLRLGLPKGRMERAVLDLLSDGGVQVTPGARGYRPHVELDCVEAKVLKPQNIVEMLMLGSRDVGFAGADWVKELSADVVEILDTCLDAVEIVAAAPVGTMVDGLHRHVVEAHAVDLALDRAGEAPGPAHVQRRREEPRARAAQREVRRIEPPEPTAAPGIDRLHAAPAAERLRSISAPSGAASKAGRSVQRYAWSSPSNRP